MKNRPVKWYSGKIVKIQQKRPETRTKVDFLFERVNIQIEVIYQWRESSIWRNHSLKYQYFSLKHKYFETKTWACSPATWVLRAVKKCCRLDAILWGHQRFVLKNLLVILLVSSFIIFSLITLWCTLTQYNWGFAFLDYIPIPSLFLAAYLRDIFL